MSTDDILVGVYGGDGCTDLWRTSTLVAGISSIESVQMSQHCDLSPL